MSETASAYRQRRATARRSVIGTGDGYNGLTPAAAFNAAFDMLSPTPLPADYRNDIPNHYVHDSLGDPALCTEEHNHPEPGE